jgi:predicted HAD superfamily Cof-like phosphohydrolase
LREFVTKFELDSRMSFEDQVSHAIRCIKEEAKEARNALDDYYVEVTSEWSTIQSVEEKKAELIKELCDLMYVTAQAAVLMQVDRYMTKSFSSVHDSNMSKLDVDGKPTFDDKGKVLKGPYYKKPDIMALIKEIDG